MLGSLIFRSIHNSLKKEHKFIYLLASLNKEKIQSSYSQEEINKIIINDEKDVLYGTIYISDETIDKLQKDVLNLKSRMTESDTKPLAMKNRDFKYDVQDFKKIFEDIAKLFFLKDNSLKHQNNKKKKTTFNVANDEEEIYIDTLDKYAGFIPELNTQNISTFIDFLSEKGMNIVNHNFLVIFRYLHHVKYDHFKIK